MSRTIDQKVVEMKFNNKQFEEAVAQSRQSIKLMEKDINLLEGVKALRNLDKAISGVDFTHMTKSIDGIKNSFSVLGTIGRSVVNKLTTDTMNKFQQMAQKTSGAIRNIFNQVYQKGYSRASKLESSAFQIKGLIERSGLEGEKAEKVTKSIKDMVNEAVTDTAFGLDQASLAASTLASTFGTDEKALERINKALKAISGVAGTTGAAYEQVADIFTDAAGKGHAMGDEFSRLSLLGINGAEEVAKYVNKDLTYRKKLNKELKKSTNHIITAEEILSLASKKKISAELFSDAFQSFFATAKEANETLDGVTANIGAAMGRLGALFIQPLIENSGPIVKFLQVVKNGISQVAKVLSNLGIPDSITKILNSGIVVATEYINNFVDAFKNGTTPLNTFLEKISKIVKAIETILQLSDDNPILNGMSHEDLYKEIFSREYDKAIKDRNKAVGNSYRTIKQIKKDFNNTSMSEDDKAIAAQKTYLNQMTDGSFKTMEQWKELYKEYYSTRYGLSKMTKEQREETLKSDWFNKLVDTAAAKEYAADMKASEESIRKIANHKAELQVEEDEIYGYNYLKDILDGIKNSASAVIDIFKTLAEAIFGTSGPLKDFSDAINGDPREARKGLNNLTKGFKEATAKIKEFVNTEGFKNFIKTIGKYIAIIGKIVGAVFKIISHLFTALSPIIIKVSDLIGKLFKSSDENQEKLSVFDRIINGLCSAIDFLGEVLLKVWGIGEDVVGWLSNNGVFDIFKDIGNKIVEFAKLAVTNWPEAWTKIKEVVGSFGSKAKEVFGWLGDKLGPIFDKIKPYLSSFKDSLSNITNIDLSKGLEWLKGIFGGTKEEASGASEALDKVNTALDKVDGTADKVGGTLNKVKSGFTSLSGIGGKGRIGAAFDLSSALPSNIPTNDVEKIVDGFKSLGIDKNDSDRAEEKAGIISKVFGWMKETFDSISFPAITAAIAAAIAAFGHYKIGSGVSKIGSGVKKIGQGFILFSKNADSMIANMTGFDANAERKKALAEIFKNIALILGVLIAGIAVVTAAVYVLSKMDPSDMWRGIAAIAVITVVMGALVGVLAYLARFLTGEQQMTSKGGISLSSGLLKGFSFSKSGDNDISHIKESAFKPLIGLAAVLGVFIVGVLLITASIAILGHMNSDKMWQGVYAFAIISAVMLAIISISLLLLKNVMNPSNGKKMDQGSAKAVGNSLFGIAAIIFVFANAVNKIAVAIKILSLLPTGSHLLESVAVFALISGFIIVLIGATFAFINTMVQETNDYKLASGSKLKEVTKILAVVALIIYVIGRSTATIMKNIALLAVSAMTGKMEVAIGATAVVMGLMVAMLIVVMGFTTLMVQKAASTKGLGPQTIKSISKVLLMAAAIIFVLGQVVGSILRNIALLTAAFSLASPSTVQDTLGAVGIVMGAMIFAIIALMAGIILLTKVSTPEKIKSASGVLSAIAVIIGIMALAIFAVGYAASQMGDVDPKVMNSLMGIVISLAALLAVMALLLIVIGKVNPQTGPMVAVIGMIVVIGLLFLAVGEAINLMTKNPITDNAIAMLKLCLIALVVMAAVCTIIAGIASKGAITGKGLLVMAAIVGALALIFTAIGKMALNIGKGVNLISKGIERLIKVLQKLGKEPTDTLKKGASKLGKAFSSIILGIIDGFIEFGQQIESRREDLKAAIVSIFGIINDAIGTTLQETFLLFLNRLSDILIALDIWLKENSETLKSVLIQIGDILYDVIKHFIDRITNDFPGWLEHLCDVLEQKSPSLTERLIQVSIAIIRGLVDGIAKHREEIVECIWNLIKELVNIIFRFFGLKAPFKIEWKAKPAFDVDSSGDTSDLEQAGEKVPDELMAGTEGKAQETVKYFKDFVEKLCEAIWDELTHSEWLQKAADFLVNWADGLGNYVYDHTLGLMDQYKDATRTKEELERAGKLIDEINEKKTVKYTDLWKLYKSQGMSESAAKQKAAKEAEDWANEQINKIKKAYGINSPSKVLEEIGEDINKGYVNGLSKTAEVYKTIDKEAETVTAKFEAINPKMSTSAIDGLKQDLKTALPKIKDVLLNSGLFDKGAFVIKPDMDLSTVEGKTSALQSIFDNMGIGVNVDAAYDMFSSLKSGNFSNLDVSSIASGFDSANNGGISDLGSGETTTNINFNQNNFSPESLSSIDIYRQTESLLGSNSTINGIMNAMGVKSSDLNLSFMQN